MADDPPELFIPIADEQRLPEWGSVAVVHPGDTVLLAFNRALTTAEGDRTMQRLREWMPGVKWCIAEQVSAVVVVRPDIPSD